MSIKQAEYAGRVKYDEAAARKYQVRKQHKHVAEMRLIDRAFARVPKTHKVLDIPCGGGRATLHLAWQGYEMAAADLSDAMLQITRENAAKESLDVEVSKQDLEKLTFPDRTFDTVLCFRLFHHFPTPTIRQRTVSELCRVARKYVALSYFSPASFTSLKRMLRARLGGKRSDKFATSLTEVQKYFAGANFELVQDFAQLPLLHTMHLALFQRVGEAKP